LFNLQSHLVTIDVDSTIYVSSILNTSWVKTNALQGLTDVKILDETSQSQSLGTIQCNILLYKNMLPVYYVCYRLL